MGELVYEMVWDCRYCRAQKLLGLTHRHCPNCGAPQDPSTRYFPADHEKVAVQNHQYVGADVACRYCGTPSSRRAHNCGQCGAPLAEGANVAALPPQAPQHLVSPPAQAAASGGGRSAWIVIVPVLALAGVAAIVLAVLWKKEQGFVVAAHNWHRSIAVERLGPVKESAWCDELPSGASVSSRHREQHGTKQVADGEDCHAEKRDRGDGTFKEEQVCKPKTKSEPIYEDKCDYEIVKWSKLRSENAEGSSATPPYWPAVSLAHGGCSSPGCEREGKRDETYTVVFKDDKGETYRCDFAEAAWSGYGDGKRYRGKLRALVGSLDCSSLVGSAR